MLKPTKITQYTKRYNLFGKFKNYWFLLKIRFWISFIEIFLQLVLKLNIFCESKEVRYKIFIIVYSKLIAKYYFIISLCTFLKFNLSGSLNFSVWLNIYWKEDLWKTSLLFGHIYFLKYSVYISLSLFFLSIYITNYTVFYYYSRILSTNIIEM